MLASGATRTIELNIVRETYIHHGCSEILEEHIKQLCPKPSDLKAYSLKKHSRFDLDLFQQTSILVLLE
jgi:hypothetical protein